MAGYIDKLNWVCRCGHMRALHGYTLTRVSDGESMPEYRPDKECKGDGCDCVLFTPSDFKYDTFRQENALAGLVRRTQTPSGISVTFIVDGAQLSVMKNNLDFKDFDDLSEEVLTDLKVPEGTDAVVYQWFTGSGFQQL